MGVWSLLNGRSGDGQPVVARLEKEACINQVARLEHAPCIGKARPQPDRACGLDDLVVDQIELASSSWVLSS